MTLVEFLTARLNEDEAVALASLNVLLGAQVMADRVGDVIPEWYSASDPRGPEWTDFATTHLIDAEFIQHHAPDRVLREVAAKRAVVRAHQSAWSREVYPAEAALPEGVEWILGLRQGLSRALRAIASAYSDHPDYRVEWA